MSKYGEERGTEDYRKACTASEQLVSKSRYSYLNGWLDWNSWAEMKGGTDGLWLLSLSLSPLSSSSFPLTITLTHSAFTSTSAFFSPFKPGKQQPKWQISINVTQASFAPDKQGNANTKKR